MWMDVDFSSASFSVNCLKIEARKEEISCFRLIYFVPQLALSENMNYEL